MGIINDFFNKIKRKENESSEDSFEKLCTAVNFICKSISVTAENKNFFRLRNNFLPNLMDVIETISNSRKSTKELKEEVLKICRSHFTPLISYCEKERFFEDDINLLKNTINEIENKLTN